MTMPPLQSGLLAALLLCGISIGLDAASQEPSENQPSDRPRVLVTNDDGIESSGLQSLVLELSKSFEVHVCAPDGDRSGASHSVTFYRATSLAKEFEIEGAMQAISLNATPADTAHYGLVHMGKDRPFDLLISGMNSASNVGELSHMSGTVGAAMEGARQGVPSMAVSLGTRDVDGAAAFARKFAQQWLERGASPYVVYSLNIPNAVDGEWKGVIPAPMGGAYIQVREYNEVEESENGRLVRGKLEISRSHPEGSDSALYHEGYVTITPLRWDWTHKEALADLADWDFE